MPIIKPSRAIQLNKSHQLVRGIIGCWFFNEGLGNKVFDLSGNGNEGTFGGDTYFVPGKYGYCLSFDGDDYVDVGAMNSVEGIPSISVIALVKPSIAGNGELRICGNWGGAGDKTLQLSRAVNEKYLFEVWNESDSSTTAYSDLPYIDIKWHHLVGVYNGIDVRIYVDGILANSSPNSLSGNTDASSNPVRIGIWATTSGFEGLIDHIIIFNRALIPEEIKQFYYNPFFIFESLISPLIFGVTLEQDAIVTPSALSLISTLNEPTIISSTTIEISALDLNVNLIDPAIDINTIVTPSALSLTSEIKISVISTDVVIDVSSLNLSSTLNEPNVITGIIIEVSSLALSTTLNEPEIITDVIIEASSLSLSVTLNEPEIITDVIIEASSLAFSVTLNEPEIVIGIIIEASFLAISSTLNEPIIGTDMTVDVSGLLISSTLIEPTIIGDTTFDASVFSITADLNTPTILAEIIIEVSSLSLAVGLITPEIMSVTIIQVAALLLNLTQNESWATSFQPAWGFDSNVIVGDNL